MLYFFVVAAYTFLQVFLQTKVFDLTWQQRLIFRSIAIRRQNENGVFFDCQVERNIPRRFAAKKFKGMYVNW